MTGPVSTTYGRGSDDERTLPDVFGSPSRYDLVLAIVPAAFLVASLVGTVLSVSWQATLLTGALVGCLAILDAIFLNPPIGPGANGS